MEGTAKAVVEEVKAEVRDPEKDKLAYDYLFKMYTMAVDLFWKKINYYILIETALFTILITMINYKFGDISIFYLAAAGFTISLYMTFMAFIDIVHLSVYDRNISTIESSVIGDNYLFRIDKAEESKNDNWQQKLAGRNMPLLIIDAMLFFVSIIWMYVAMIYW